MLLIFRWRAAPRQIELQLNAVSSIVPHCRSYKMITKWKTVEVNWCKSVETRCLQALDELSTTSGVIVNGARLQVFFQAGHDLYSGFFWRCSRRNVANDLVVTQAEVEDQTFRAI